MTSTQQRAALQRQIWQIANDVRGSVDGWDFKQYVLGTLFYRFISENFTSYIEADDDGRIQLKGECNSSILGVGKKGVRKGSKEKGTILLLGLRKKNGISNARTNLSGELGVESPV